MVVLLVDGVHGLTEHDRYADRGLCIAAPDDVSVWRGLASEGSHALVLGTTKDERAVRAHAALAGDQGLASSWRTTALGPLGLLLTARQALSSAPGIGALPAAFDAVTRDTWAAVWLPTVTRLADPAPSVLTHLRSWFPARDGYLTVLGEDSRVESVARAARRPRSQSRPRGLLVASGDVPEGAAALAHAGSGATADYLMAVSEEALQARFGTSRCVELVAVADDGLGPHRVESCPVCDIDVPAGFCPYCRVRSSPIHTGAGAA